MPVSEVASCAVLNLVPPGPEPRACTPKPANGQLNCIVPLPPSPLPLPLLPPPSLADLFSHIDTYVAVWYGDHKLGCTVTYGNQPSPVWNEVRVAAAHVLGAAVHSSCLRGHPLDLWPRRASSM